VVGVSTFKLFYYKVLSAGGKWKMANPEIEYTFNDDPKTAIQAIMQALAKDVEKEIRQTYNLNVKEMEYAIEDAEKKYNAAINLLLNPPEDSGKENEGLNLVKIIQTFKNSESKEDDLRGALGKSVALNKKVDTGKIQAVLQKEKQKIKGQSKKMVEILDDINVFNDFRNTEKDIKKLMSKMKKTDGTKVAFDFQKFQGEIFEFAVAIGLLQYDEINGTFSDIKLSGVTNKKADVISNVLINTSPNKTKTIEIGLSIKSTLDTNSTQFIAHGGNIDPYLRKLRKIKQSQGFVDYILNKQNSIDDLSTRRLIGSMLADYTVGGENTPNDEGLKERALILINLRLETEGLSVKAKFLNKYFKTNPNLRIDTPFKQDHPSYWHTVRDQKSINIFAGDIEVAASRKDKI